MSIASIRLVTLVAPLLVSLALIQGRSHGSEVERDLSERLTAIERQLDTLEARAAGRLTADRAAALDVLVRDILHDSEVRAAALGRTTSNGGHDSGFFITSTDGTSRLKLSGYLQTRLVLSHRGGATNDGDIRGFDIRRLRIKASGSVVDPSWTYSFTLSLNNRGIASLTDGYIDKSLSDGWSIRVGQFHAPFLLEELWSAKRQPTLDRTFFSHDTTFNMLRTQGVQVTKKNDRQRVRVMLHDGPRGINSAWDADGHDVALTGRYEMLTGEGTWKQFGGFDSRPGGETAVMIGAAASWDQRDPGMPGDRRVETTRWTVDATAHGDGWSANAAIVGQHSETESGQRVERLAAVASLGYFITEDTQLVGQVAWADYERASDDTPIGDVLVISAALHHWLNTQVRWSCDLSYAFDPVPAAASSGGRGWRTDAPGTDGQVLIRTQLQLIY